MSSMKPPKKGSTASEVLQGEDLTGRYILITGCNTGIGLETAKALALHGAHVTMANRNLDASLRLEELIKNENPSAEVATISLDLMDFESVERCAKEYLATGKPIHVLILNAGVFNPPERITKYGLEATFQVNHLAQMHLTNLLTDKLVQSAPSRLVVVSSRAHTRAELPKNPDQWPEYFSPPVDKMTAPITAYNVSKLANTMFAQVFDDRMKERGVRAFSVHPGVIKSDLMRNSYWLGKVIDWFDYFKLGTINTEQGAAAAVYCATAKGLEEYGGRYFHELEVQPVDQSSSSFLATLKTPGMNRAAGDRANWQPFWQLCERLIEKAISLN